MRDAGPRRAPALLVATATLCQFSFWACTVLGSAPAAAQQAAPVDPLQIQKKIDATEAERKRLRRPVPHPELIGQIATGVPAIPLFRLDGVHIEGARTLALAGLKKSYAPYLGKTVSQADLESITAAIGALYRQAGFNLTRAIIPVQDVQHGVLRIRVIEGSISEIKIEGDDEDRFGAREVLGSLLSEHPSRISSVERKLVSLNDVPGLRVADIAIEEIGEATGKFRLTVRVTTWNIYTTLGLDNSGSHAVGPLQLYSATFFNSYLLKGDSLGLSLSTVPDATRDLRSTRLSYDVPIGTDGFRIGGSSYYGDVWPDDERRNTNTQTINRTDELRGSFAPLQSRAATINLFGAIGFVDENEKDIFGTDYNDHVRWGRIGIDFRAQDNIGGTNYGSIALRQGLNIAEATQQGDLLSSRPDASPNFSVLEASYTRYQTLTDAISVKASATGQFSSGPLLSSQMFYLGGAAFGPGYFSGDNGLAGTVELRYDQPIQSSWMKAFQVYAFVDGGETWNRGEEMQYLGSVGIGVRVKLFDEVYASLAYAAPIGESTKTEEYRAGRVLFSLSTSLKLCPDRAQLRCF